MTLTPAPQRHSKYAPTLLVAQFVAHYSNFERLLLGQVVDFCRVIYYKFFL